MEHCKPIKFDMRFISPAVKFLLKTVREGRDSSSPQSGRRRAQSAGWVRDGKRQKRIEERRRSSRWAGWAQGFVACCD